MHPSSLALATDPRAPLAALLSLAADHPAEVAAHPALIASPSALQKADLFALISLAACPASPPPLLALLAAHQRHEIRATVAQNPACPPALLTRLALDPHPEVHGTALQSPAAHGLAALVADLPPYQHEIARALLARGELYAAQSCNCPAPLLLRLGLRDAETLDAVLGNPACTDELCRALAEGWQGRDPALLGRTLKARAFTRLYASTGSERWLDATAALRLLRHTAVEPALMASIFSPSVRLKSSFHRRNSGEQILQLVDAALGHPACDRALLRRLATHRLGLVRAEAARHHRTPPATLLKLLGDPRYEVRRAAWYNPRLPSGWHERLLRLGFLPGLARRAASGPLAPEDARALRKAGPWLSEP